MPLILAYPLQSEFQAGHGYTVTSDSIKSKGKVEILNKCFNEPSRGGWYLHTEKG